MLSRRGRFYSYRDGSLLLLYGCSLRGLGRIARTEMLSCNLVTFKRSGVLQISFEVPEHHNDFIR